MPEAADDKSRGSLHDPDEDLKLVLASADLTIAGRNAARADNPEETDTKPTDSQRGKEKDSAGSSEIKTHVSVPALKNLWVSVLRKLKKPTEEENDAEEDKLVEAAKKGDDS